MLLVINNDNVFCPQHNRGVALSMDYKPSCGGCEFYRGIQSRFVKTDGVQPTSEIRECVDCRWCSSKESPNATQ